MNTESPSPILPGAVQRRHWDSDAERYHREHASYLDTFYWCPERLSEEDAGLLGDQKTLAHSNIVEVGCGSAPCGAWVAQQFGQGGAQVTALDISHDMLTRAPRVEGLHLLQADATSLPIATDHADVVFSSFGAYPFIPDLNGAMAEVARILRPGGRVVISANHPSGWIFPDDPDELTASIPYFQDAYLEWEAGELTYAEFHHTMGDWIRAFASADLALVDLIEPQWIEGTPPWGQWSATRGAIFPGTAIFVLEL